MPDTNDIRNATSGQTADSRPSTGSGQITLPSIELPKGGGGIRGIEEKFQTNPVTGTSTFSIPLPLSASRHGFSPAVGLGYNSGAGNSQFGLGWQLGLASIKRKTARKLPEYRDEEESDTFILSGAEDLVPVLEKQGNAWINYKRVKSLDGVNYTVSRYRPRIEGLFARIEKWKNNSSGDVYWKTLSKENVHSWFGLTDADRVSDPDDPGRVFEWMISRTQDNRGNLIVYEYKKEDYAGVEKKSNERYRIGHCTQLYLRQVLYGNKTPY